MNRLPAVVASVAVLAAICTATPANAATKPPSWHITKIAKLGPLTVFDTIVSSTKSDAWAFGRVGEWTNGQEIASHWNGRAWRSVALPKVSSGVIGASASSPANVWAVANLKGGGGVALRWNGHKWTVAGRFPMWRGHGGPEFPRVSAFSPTNVWIYGMTALNSGTGTWHFDGHHWTYSNRGFLPSLASAVSAQNIWAIDTNADPSTLGHYNGKKWTSVSLGSLRPSTVASLDSIYARTADDVWVSGYDTTKQATFMAHWNGRAWQRISVPGSWSISAMIGDGAGGLWLSAFDPTNQKSTLTVLLHRTRTGVVTRVTVPAGSLTSQFEGFARIPGTGSLWGAGSLEAANGSRSDGAVFRWN